MDRIRSLTSAAAAALAMFAMPAGATLIDLNDGNSTVRFDTTNGRGMYDWLVDGSDYMFQQWFWYRIGDERERPIDALGNESFVIGPAGWAIVNYGGAGGLQVDLLFELTGGAAGSNRSNMAETITLRNAGAAPLRVNFFQYSDFDLRAFGNDFAQFTGPNSARVWSPDALGVAETVVAPAVTNREISAFADLRDRLNDADMDDLLNTAVGPAFGPFDAVWGFQWEITLAAGQSFEISKVKNIAPLPEPGTGALIGASLIGLALAVSARTRRFRQ